MIRREEFENELSTRGFYSRWSTKSSSELRRLFESRVAQMVGYQQNNPHHCYDLYHHTLKAVEYIANSAKNEETLFLCIAAFFHDIGKPEVAKWKNGKKTFYGHPCRSAMIADAILEKMGYSKKERDHICFYVANHDDFISFVTPEDHAKIPTAPIINEKTLRAFLVKLKKKYPEFSEEEWAVLWKNITMLMYADLCAQADVAVWHGETIDSKAHKQSKILLARRLLENMDSL